VRDPGPEHGLFTAFWKDCRDTGGPAWDGTNNHRAFHAGELCATLNNAGIYTACSRTRRPTPPRHFPTGVSTVSRYRLNFFT